MKLIAVGDCVCDTYLDEGVYYPGGQAINVAVNARQSGAAQAQFLGIFGDDEAAAHVKRCLEVEGVSTERCRRVYAPTPTPGVKIVNTDRVFIRGPRDTAAHLFNLRIAEEDLELISTFDVCHTTNEAGIDSELERIHARTTLSYDFSIYYDEQLLQRLCPHMDIAFLSGADKSLDACHSLAELALAAGSRIAVVTRGEAGSLCHARDHGVFEQACIPCEALDTMGAGDSFAAAFLVRYFDTHNISEALHFAAERAAHTCRVHGAFGHPHPIEHSTSM